jgi:hypothetical protein
MHKQIKGLTTTRFVHYLLNRDKKNNAVFRLYLREITNLFLSFSPQRGHDSWQDIPK